MDGTVTLILVRHGETVGNVSGIVQGQTDGALTERGVEQARAAARTLAGARIDAVYTSDLKRAYDTAAILIEGRQGSIPIPDARLREQHLGVYVGGPVAVYADAMEKAGAVREMFDPEGGEPSGEMRKRVAEFLRDVRKRHPGGTVLAVTHQGVMRMVAELTGTGIPAAHAEPVSIRIDATG